MANAPQLDRRIQRTRTLLRDALFHLIVERGYQAINVQNITEQANLGRTTFYLHYHDKDALLQASINALMDELQRGVEPMVDEDCPYQVRCVRIFAQIARHQQVYRALLKESGTVDIGTTMRTYFVALLQRSTRERQRRDSTHTSDELIAAHAAGALFGLVVWWLDHDAHPTAEMMGKVYFQLLAKGAESMLNLTQQYASN